MRLKLLVSNLKNEKQPDSKILELEKSFCIIGRKAADIVLDEPRCSKQQAVFYQGFDGGLHIRDMGSTNGTFVNSAKIIDSPLKTGDEIRVGKCYLSVLEFEGVERTGVKNFKGPPLNASIDTSSSHETAAHDSIGGNSAKHTPPALPKHSGDLQRVISPDSPMQHSFIHFVDDDGTENRMDFKELLSDLARGGPTVGPRKSNRSSRR